LHSETAGDEIPMEKLVALSKLENRVVVTRGIWEDWADQPNYESELMDLSRVRKAARQSIAQRARNSE